MFKIKQQTLSKMGLHKATRQNRESNQSLPTTRWCRSTDMSLSSRIKQKRLMCRDESRQLRESLESKQHIEQIAINGNQQRIATVQKQQKQQSIPTISRQRSIKHSRMRMPCLEWSSISSNSWKVSKASYYTVPAFSACWLDHTKHDTTLALQCNLKHFLLKWCVTEQMDWSCDDQTQLLVGKKSMIP